MSEDSSDSITPTIAGGWLGTYEYRSRLRPPVTLEASFSIVGQDGTFRGSVVEDSPLGRRAVTHGLQTGRHIRFTRLGSVSDHFQGTLSENGTSISGIWERKTRRSGRIVRTVGHWQARRLWAETDAQDIDTEAA